MSVLLVFKFINGWVANILISYPFKLIEIVNTYQEPLHHKRSWGPEASARRPPRPGLRTPRAPRGAHPLWPAWGIPGHGGWTRRRSSPRDKRFWLIFLGISFCCISSQPILRKMTFVSFDSQLTSFVFPSL